MFSANVGPVYRQWHCIESDCAADTMEILAISIFKWRSRSYNTLEDRQKGSQKRQQCSQCIHGTTT